MAGAAPQTFPRAMVLRLPDGTTRRVPLDRDQITLGRSTGNDLVFPDDVGLSRQHLVIQKSANGWSVTDLNSKNGTLVNGSRISGSHMLTPVDKIHAGHLSIEFADVKAPVAANTVVYIDPAQAAESTTAMTSLDGLL